MRKRGNGARVYYIYNKAHQLMLSWDAATGTETDYIHLGAITLARATAGTVSYPLPDWHGSPLIVTDANGSISSQPVYLGYGRTTAAGRDQVPGYTGAVMDSNTGATYLGARYLYHKRFTSPDPAPLNPLSPVGLNRYAYANNNPVRYTDPFGRQAEDETCDTACQIREQYEKDFGRESELAQRAQDIAEGASKTADVIEAGAEMAVPLPAAKLSALGKLGKFLKRLITPASKSKLQIGQKVTNQMGKRGWSQQSINEAIQSGTQVRAVNRATGNPATRYVHPETGQSVVVDNVTGEVSHVGGPGFRYGPQSGDLP